METFIKTRTALLYVYWRAGRATPAEYRMALFFVLLISLWAATVIALIPSLNHKMPPVQPATLHFNTSQQVAYQQFSDRYKDPSMTHFLGE